jgi:predicted O-methyltransferase YrrM
MKNYKFTKNWFGSTDIEKILPLYTLDELHVLEIGSFEGKSTVWFIENLLKNENSTITCIDPWMNFYQNSNSFESYNPSTKTQSGVDYLIDDIKGKFLYNINETGYPTKVIVRQGMSYLELPKLIDQNKLYDVIFIDGNHTSPFVLTDAVLCWYLLKPNGIMIFDDYLWTFKNGKTLTPKTLTPKLAIDSFVEIFSDYSSVILDGYRKAIKKIK